MYTNITYIFYYIPVISIVTKDIKYIFLIYINNLPTIFLTNCFKSNIYNIKDMFFVINHFILNYRLTCYICIYRNSSLLFTHFNITDCSPI